MNCDSWPAIGALGQWFAGLMTLLVVLYALKSSRPRLRVDVLGGSWQNAERGMAYRINKKPVLFASSVVQVAVLVSNLGHVPVTVLQVLFRNPRGYDDITILHHVDEETMSFVTLAPQEILFVFISGQDLSNAGVTRIDTAAAVDVSLNRWTAKTRLRDRITRSFYLVFGKGRAELHETDSLVPRTVDAEQVYRHMGPRPGWSLGPAARTKKGKPDSGSGSS